MTNPIAEYYDSTLQEGDLIITRKSKHYFSVALSWLFGIGLLILGSYTNVQILLFGLLLVLLPWISRQWRFPQKVIFSKEGYLILETGNIIPNINKIREEHITELQVEKVRKSSETSPFQEGNEDIIYNFMLDTPVKRLKLMRLEFRRDEDEKIDEIRSFLLQSLKILKSSSSTV